MGVDYYNCTGCNEIFTTCGDYRSCCKCYDMFCNYCNTIEKVAVEDCGECTEEHSEGSECDQPQWMITVAEKCEKGCKEYHFVCLECQQLPPPPWTIDDFELLEILAKIAGYPSVEDARTSHEKERMEKMLTEKQKDKERTEKKQKDKDRLEKKRTEKQMERASKKTKTTRC